MNARNPFEGAPIIYRYTRAQAIEDGVLVDLTEWAKETGFKIPVACTSAVWHGYVEPPPNTKEFGQSIRGRAHDLLWMLYCRIRGSATGNCLHFDVVFLQAPDRRETAKLKSICGPGDEGEPVLTILLPDED